MAWTSSCMCICISTLITWCVIISVSFSEPVLSSSSSSASPHPIIQPRKQQLMQALNAHPNPPRRIFPHNNHHADAQLRGSDTGLLVASPTTLASNEEWITVRWFNMSYTGRYDWIGLFNATASAATHAPFAAPPLKFQYICPAFQGCEYAPANGALRFRVLNRRTQYRFAYVSGSAVYHEVYGVSDLVTYANLYEPMHVRLAHIPCGSALNAPHTNDVKEEAEKAEDTVCMQIVWTQKAVQTPVAKYGTANDSLPFTARSNHAWTTLNRSSFCDQEYGLAAGTIGYFEMGYTVSVYLMALPPNTHIFYQVGDDVYGYSAVLNFTSPPMYGQYPSPSAEGAAAARKARVGDGQTMIVFGDMGDVAIDYSMHHSFDWNNAGELYSINTTHTMAAQYVRGPKEWTDALVHIGDISYAVGYLSEWDDFLHQIAPLAAHIPYMTGIGNHEYAWTGEWKPPPDTGNADAYGNADSGGECGVAYNALFPFANADPWAARAAGYDPRVVQPWYVFDYGRVRTVLLSTENDFSAGSAQWRWFKGVLQNTSRSVFPWVFVAGHRPMYSNDAWSGDVNTAAYLRQELEPLLREYKVGLGFWGHEHSYGRTCAVYNGTCVGEGDVGVVHLVVGMAGYELTKSIAPPPDTEYIEFQTNTIYGFVHLNVLNDTHLLGKFIDANTTDVVEQFYVVNPFKA